MVHSLTFRGSPLLTCKVTWRNMEIYVVGGNENPLLKYPFNSNERIDFHISPLADYYFQKRREESELRNIADSGEIIPFPVDFSL